ncbi:thioesterase family protein [Aeromicrobium phragmitis]|uniref:thioesterase family protein n=1 Tax=Aeromicrobium phragmitis TaxID=2478914 RepID=UPI00140AA5AB|nr:thioesterase family protein [Aeromicrobium phragmitis]
MTDDTYAHDTSSRSIAPGRRALTLTDRWNTPLGKPNGGYLLAAMLRGLAAEVDGAGDPLVASVSYLRSPEAGDAELATEIIRTGRRVQTASATLTQEGKGVAHLVANFAGRPDGGRTEEFGQAPELPDPEKCFDPLASGMKAEGIFGQVEYRLPAAPGWATGAPSGDPSALLWQRLRGGREVDFPALALLCDSYAPPVMEIGESVSMTVQLSVHLHRLPAPGWIATRLHTRHLVNGFHEEDCELWDGEGRLVAQSRQLAILLG